MKVAQHFSAGVRGKKTGPSRKDARPCFAPVKSHWRPRGKRFYRPYGTRSFLRINPSTEVLGYFQHVPTGRHLLTITPRVGAQTCPRDPNLR
jgi:hypothetical protein